MAFFHKKTEYVEKLLPDEPAVKNYFLDKGFSDLGATIRESFRLNAATANKNVKAISADTSSKAIKFFKGILRVCAIISMYVFGTILTAVISFFHSLIIFVIMAFVYLAFWLSRFIDNVYIGIRRIAVVCDKCKVRSTLPGYKCPSCGAIHYRLRPNVYGIVTHKCECGQKLPATFFTHTKNATTGDKYSRKKLEAVCANPNCSIQVFSEDSRPICIPIAGSRSVGKTAYLTAASHMLIEDVLPGSGCTVDFYSSEKTTKYAEITSDYSTGRTSMTIEPANSNLPSSFSLSYFVDHSSLKPRRLVHMFDIAGETFVRNSEHERQLHYSYSDGVILIIDPFCIPDVSDQFEESLNDVDKKGIGNEDLDRVLASLVTKMRNACVLAQNQKIDIPIAIVINKIDEPGLDTFFGEDARNSFKAAHSDLSESDVDDQICRQFLRSQGMGNFVNTVEVNFKTVKYFSCSAIGHSREDGPYSPRGVIEPIGWIVSSSDKAFAKLLQAQKALASSTS